MLECLSVKHGLQQWSLHSVAVILRVVLSQRACKLEYVVKQQLIPLPLPE